MRGREEGAPSFESMRKKGGVKKKKEGFSFQSRR